MEESLNAVDVTEANNSAVEIGENKRLKSPINAKLHGSLEDPTRSAYTKNPL